MCDVWQLLLIWKDVCAGYNNEESDNQSEKHLFKQPGIGTTEYFETL